MASIPYRYDDDLNTSIRSLQIDGKSLRNVEFWLIIQNFDTGFPSRLRLRVVLFIKETTWDE